MDRDKNRPSESPTAIGMMTGMEVPGLGDVRGPMEEVLIYPPAYSKTWAAELDILPGQSGAEGLAELPDEP